MSNLTRSTKRMAEMLKVLGHPSRIEIVKFLHAKKSDTLTVKQIQEALQLAQVETSQHLKVLKDVSVLVCTKKGTNVYYSINDKVNFVNELVSLLIKNKMKA